MLIFLRSLMGNVFTLEVETTDTYADVVENLMKVVDNEIKAGRSYIKPLITTNPTIYFNEIKKHFEEGMRLTDINVTKEMTGTFFDNRNIRYAKLRPLNSTWMGGLNEETKEEYLELKKKIKAHKRDEESNEQAMNDYYSGDWDNIVGVRGGGRRKGRKSKTKRKGSKRKGSKRRRRGSRTRRR